MIKLILFSVLAVMSLALPLSLIFTSGTKPKIPWVLLGAGYYLTANLILNLFKNAWMMKLEPLGAMLFYLIITVMTWTLTASLYFRRLSAVESGKMSLIYGGYAMINTFVASMVSYSPLIQYGLLSLRGQTDQIHGEAAVLLHSAYSTIQAKDIILAGIELLFVFLIIAQLFQILLAGKGPRRFAEFATGLFAYMLIQYGQWGTGISFIAYAFLLAGLIGYLYFSRPRIV